MAELHQTQSAPGGKFEPATPALGGVLYLSYEGGDALGLTKTSNSPRRPGLSFGVSGVSQDFSFGQRSSAAGMRSANVIARALSAGASGPRFAGARPESGSGDQVERLEC